MGAFLDNNIETVVIGTGIREIADMAFKGTPVQTLTIYTTTPPTLAPDAFDDPSSMTLYVPAESVGLYEAEWQEIGFGTILPIE